MPRLPELLIIGAMKSGTTSLYIDLAKHAGVFQAGNKEPHDLCSDRVLTPEGLATYAEHYAGAKPDEILCDASTGYTKLPHSAGVAERALRVLPEGFKVIYVVRHPIDRTLSHYRHDVVEETVEGSIDEALRTKPDYIDFSRYAYQLRPWVDAVGLPRILVLSMEEYVRDRAAVFQRVEAFLGTQLQGNTESPPRAYNQSAKKPQITRFWDAVSQSTVYRKLLRPLMPLNLRLKLFEILLPKAKLDPTEPCEATLGWLRAELGSEAEELAKLTGSEPLWLLSNQPNEPVQAG